MRFLNHAYCAQKSVWASGEEEYDLIEEGSKKTPKVGEKGTSKESFGEAKDDEAGKME